MLEHAPTNEEMISIIGDDRFKVWLALCDMIDGLYEMDRTWGYGGKAWGYEYKYRRGGKTLCALYAKENCFGLMIIFGKAEREKFENEREAFSENTKQVYDNATTYHDGKWMMFLPENNSYFDDYKKLLSIKCKPNRK